jgi:hypothetical protein
MATVDLLSVNPQYPIRIQSRSASVEDSTQPTFPNLSPIDFSTPNCHAIETPSLENR